MRLHSKWSSIHRTSIHLKPFNEEQFCSPIHLKNNSPLLTKNNSAHRFIRTTIHKKNNIQRISCYIQKTAFKILLISLLLHSKDMKNKFPIQLQKSVAAFKILLHSKDTKNKFPVLLRTLIHLIHRQTPKQLSDKLCHVQNDRQYSNNHCCRVLSALPTFVIFF